MSKKKLILIQNFTNLPTLSPFRSLPPPPPEQSWLRQCLSYTWTATSKEDDKYRTVKCHEKWLTLIQASGATRADISTIFFRPFLFVSIFRQTLIFRSRVCQRLTEDGPCSLFYYFISVNSNIVRSYSVWKIDLTWIIFTSLFQYKS